MRVLHVGKFYPPVRGGMERVVQSLCVTTQDRLANQVLAFHTGRRTLTEVVDSVPVTRAATLGSIGSVPVSPAFLSRLSAADADVMVLHEPNPWALLAYAAVRPRIPLAIWFHSEVVRPRLQYGLCYAPVARAAYRAARRFVVSSPALAEHAAALQPFRDRVTVVPFGIDGDAWQPDERVRRRAARIRAETSGPLVVFAGRLVGYKGVDVLIEAAAPLELTVTVVGDGPMRARWTRLATERHGRATFRFTGEVDQDELRAHLAAADLFVLPSLTRAEAFGMAQLEAMACARPVISTRLPSGVPWVNQHDESGLVVTPGDVESLRAALARLAADADLRARLGAGGQRRARQEFAMRRMADGFVAVCRDVANEAC